MAGGLLGGEVAGCCPILSCGSIRNHKFSNFCCSLAVVYWLLFTGCCLLAVVYWLLFTGCCLLAVVYWLLFTYCYCLLTTCLLCPPPRCPPVHSWHLQSHMCGC